MGNMCVKYFKFRPVVQEMQFEDFLLLFLALENIHLCLM